MFTALRVWIALEWLNSGIGKLLNPKYVGGFAATNDPEIADAIDNLFQGK